MKFTQKWKNFWNIQKHATGGFTLVELIVGIAILAILAGVAVPAYNGYIAKANEAADQQLLAAINTAFSAACVEKGVNSYDLDSTSADMPLVGEVGEKKIDLDNVAPAEVREAFAVYLAGNEETTFSVITDLVYDSLKHQFVDIASESVTVSFAGTYVTLSGEDIQKLKESAFSQELTMAELMGKIEVAAGVVQIAGDGSPLYNLASSSEAQTFLMSMLGTTPEEQYLRFENIQKTLVDSGMTEDEAIKQMQSYNVVLMASQSANDVTDNVLSLLQSDKDGDEMKAAFKNAVEGDGANAEEGLAQVAMAYGLYTSYIARYPDRANEGDDSDPYAVLSELGSDEFKAYMETDEAQTDLEGYLSSMNMINNGVTGNPDAVEELFLNGFASDELVDLLGGLTNN